MKRSITLITLFVLIVVSYGLYNLKYEVEDLKDHANGLKSQMEEDRRAIKVLEAEWAYLSRPDRLQRLSSKFLTLEPTVARQVGDMADLRLKPMDGLEPSQPVVDTAEAGRPVPVPQSSSGQAPLLPVSDRPVEDVQ
jgi:hypothetical protein